MSGASAVHLTLPQWEGGSRKIRYLYLADATSFRLAESHDEGTKPPLYLGADLFSNTDIRTENHPRYHAKFAKKGLATKIHFSPEYRFHGLKVSASSNSLWFYSVQGLFRVAFELYSKKEQLAVLENFQDVWKLRINDKPLEMSYSLCKQLDSVTPEVSDAGPKIDIMRPQDCQTGQDSAAVGGVDTVGTSADHDYCSFPQQCLETDSCQTILSTVQQTLHCLDDKLSSGIQSLTEQQLQTILLFLDHIDKYIYGQVEEKDVTDLVSELLKIKEWGCVYSSSLLNCVACWLGQQFHAAKDSISQKVEGFKVQHIERISELPPAGELATQLFPEAMQTLLLHWMGLNEESTLEKRHSESPILLLILEFANHNLITGVAHVLYSSLICK